MTQAQTRIAWVDYAKGLCIILVVMMQSTLDYGYTLDTEGWLHSVVAFARPFRMPDFFLLSGLFLARSINAPWREYLDRKVVHFVYFYLLWLSIQLGVTEAGLLFSDPAGFATVFIIALVVPVGSLWFVHMLAIFYLVTRWIRHVPKLTIFIIAVILHTGFRLHLIETHWIVADEFFDRYVYFFTGYAAAPWIFAFANRVRQSQALAITGLIMWAIINGIMTTSGYSDLAGISLVLGFMGAAAVVSVGSLLSVRDWANGLRYAGAHSIVIYLSFFLPMKVLLKLFVITGVVGNVGLACSLITLGAVVIPLIFHRLIRNTPLIFLYRRPAAFKLVQHPLPEANTKDRVIMSRRWKTGPRPETTPDSIIHTNTERAGSER